jgi:hypothetical protein
MLLGTTQAQVSAPIRCRPVSVGRLMECLTTLGQDVEVTVKPRHASWGRPHVRQSAARLIALPDRHGAT